MIFRLRIQLQKLLRRTFNLVCTIAAGTVIVLFHLQGIRKPEKYVLYLDVCMILVYMTRYSTSPPSCSKVARGDPVKSIVSHTPNISRSLGWVPVSPLLPIAPSSAVD